MGPARATSEYILYIIEKEYIWLVLIVASVVGDMLHRELKHNARIGYVCNCNVDWCYVYMLHRELKDNARIVCV